MVILVSAAIFVLVAQSVVDYKVRTLMAESIENNKLALQIIENDLAVMQYLQMLNTATIENNALIYKVEHGESQ